MLSLGAHAQTETSGTSTMEQAKNSALSLQVEQLSKSIDSLRKAMQVLKEEAKTEALIEVNQNINSLKYPKLKNFESRIFALEQDKPYYTASNAINATKNAKQPYKAKKTGIATLIAKGSIFGLVSGNQAQALYVNGQLLDSMGQNIIGKHVGSRSFQLVGQTYMKAGETYNIHLKSTGEIMNNVKILIIQP